MTVYKIEDFVVRQMFLPYVTYFIESDYLGCFPVSVQRRMETKLRRKPELIIELLEENPEAKKKVFNRIHRFGGVKFYKYLNMDSAIIKYVNDNLAEMEKNH